MSKKRIKVGEKDSSSFPASEGFVADVVCFLCDKIIKPTDNVSVGMQSGTQIHMDCHKTWLIEKIRGREV